MNIRISTIPRLFFSALTLLSVPLHATPGRITAIHGYALYVDATGKVWEWGTRRPTLWPIPETGGPPSEDAAPRIVPLPVPVEKVLVTGSDEPSMAFAITTDGRWFGWGRASTRLFPDNFRTQPSSPIELTGLKGSRDFAAEGNANYACCLWLNPQGQMYYWEDQGGRIRPGDLGTAMLKRTPAGPSPRIRIFPQDVFVRVEVARDSVAALTEGGEVIAWGAADDSDRPSNIARSTPMKWETAGGKVRAFQLGERVCKVAFDDGRLLWKSKEPEKIDLTPIGVITAFGDLAPYDEGLVLNDKGEVWRFSRNTGDLAEWQIFMDSGVIPDRSNAPIQCCRLFLPEPASEIRGSFILTRSGSVYSIGQAEAGPFSSIVGASCAPLPVIGLPTPAATVAKKSVRDLEFNGVTVGAVAGQVVNILRSQGFSLEDHGPDEIKAVKAETSMTIRFVPMLMKEEVVPGVMTIYVSWGGTSGSRTVAIDKSSIVKRCIGKFGMPHKGRPAGFWYEFSDGSARFDLAKNSAKGEIGLSDEARLRIKAEVQAFRERGKQGPPKTQVDF